MAQNYQEPFERLKSEDENMETSGERRCIRFVRSFMKRSQQYREPHIELARKSRELYENWSPSSKSVIQRANLKLPFGFTIIETQMPQVLDIFFKGGPPVQMKGQGIEDAVWEDLITDFQAQQMEKMKFQTKSAIFIKSMLLDGTAIAKVPYKYKEIEAVERRTEVDPVTGKSSTIKIPKTVVTWDGPDLEIIPIYDFFPDWSVKQPGSIEAMRGCVHRTFKSMASLRSAGVYKNLDELERSVKNKGNDAWAVPYYSEDSDSKSDFEDLQDNEPGIKDEGRVEVWEFWGLYDKDGKGNFSEYLIVIGNGDVEIRKEENFYDLKFKPFVACPNYIRESEFYGIPELMAVRSLIKEANTIRNARLDNINLSVNPMWLADRAAGINARSLYSRPNGIVWTNDINGIKPMPPLDPSIGSQQEVAFIQQDIQNATALVNAAPIASSLGKQFGRSATGVNFIQSFSSSRIGLKARVLADFYFKRVAELMLMTNKQFVTDEQWVRLTDANSLNPWEKLPLEAFVSNYDFTTETTMENGGPEGQLAKMQSVAQILQAAEGSQPGTVKMDVVLESLLRPLLGRQVKRFVRGDQERQDMQAQQLAATQAVNAAQGMQAEQPNAVQPDLNQAPALDVLTGLGLTPQGG